MADTCPWSERVVNAGDPIDAEVSRHAETCVECGAELFAHDQLIASFRGVARPSLSPHFRSRMMARVEMERRRKKIVRRRLVTLRLYWLAASIVCAAVLANLTLSSSISVQQSPILFGLAAFVLPIAVVLVAIRTNPF